MNSDSLAHTAGVVRNLRTDPQGDDERHLITFLTYLKDRRVPRPVASSLAWAIAESGEILPTKAFNPIASVHSTGGPGSLSTLLAPILVASCGIYVPMVSVRGSVAGAIDSLAAIPGYTADMAAAKIIDTLGHSRLVHVRHTESLAPADLILWKLREQTNSKAEPTLIAASLLGKKLATGAVNGAVDIRVGAAGNAGVSMAQAMDTAHVIVGTANDLGMRITCVFSDATRLAWHRLGRIDAVLSVWDILTSTSLQTHPHVQFCMEIAACACHAASPATTLSAWRGQVANCLASGDARRTFEGSIQAHGASLESLTQLQRQSEGRVPIQVPYSGELSVESISPLFRALRDGIGSESPDAVGLEINENTRHVVVYLPRKSPVNETHVTQSVQSLFVERGSSMSFQPLMLMYNGQVVTNQT
jgi:pyrimidine-nucleoside phosphorylase